MRARPLSWIARPPRRAALALTACGLFLAACTAEDKTVAEPPPTDQLAQPSFGSGDLAYGPIGAPVPAFPSNGTIPSPGAPPDPEAVPEGDPDAEIPAEAPRATGGAAGPVALLLPLSGPQGALGRAMLDASQLAVHDLAGQEYRLIVEDTGGTPAGAVRAVNQALEQGARLILGPLLAGSVEAITPFAQEAGVNIISFSTRRQVAGPGVFTLGFLPELEVDRIVGYAVDQGHQDFAVLAPDNPYGRTIVRDLERITSERRVRVVSVAYYNPQARDFSETVRAFARYDARAQALEDQRRLLAGRTDAEAEAQRQALRGRATFGDVPFDALLLPDGGRRLISVGSLLPYFEIGAETVQFLGTGLWDDPTTGSEAALTNGWYAAPAPETRQQFEARYRETYGAEPPRLATLAYDAVALSAVLARRGPQGYGFETLTSPSGYAGIDGIFRFLPNGLVQRGLAVLRMTPEGPVIVAPARNTFQDLTN